MFSTELISMVCGAFTGFLFRYMAQKSQDQKEIFERLILANKQTTENQNKAVQRVSIDAGRTVRQIIVLTVLFGAFAAPFILPFFGVPTFIEVDVKNPEGLFGFIPETGRKAFVELNGFFWTSENRQVLLSIVGFYFGSAAANNKS
jgi:predicted histidine transporter YuiF (NhaC family)